ncbi:MAG: hypothetical protein H7834_09685 [Magnetococcus sp. YQC-9]
MSLQQVNFYQESFHPRFDPLALRTIGQLLLLLWLLVLGNFLFFEWQLSRERARIAELHKQKDQLTTRVTELSTLYPARPAKPELVSEIERLEQDKRLKSRMYVLLNEGSLGGGDKGFSRIFRELAAVRTEGAWVTGIGVFDNGRQLVLEGASENKSAERIPRVIQAVVQRPAFSGYAFNHFRIQPQKEGASLLTFQVKTGTDQELERFWEKKEHHEPDILRKSRTAIEQEQERLRKMSQPLSIPAPNPPPPAKPGGKS